MSEKMRKIVREFEELKKQIDDKRRQFLAEIENKGRIL